MPIVFVYGVPSNEEPRALKNLLGDIQETVAGVQELRLKKEDVIVFFPKDLVEEGLGEEIIIFVKGLYEKPERTDGVLKNLAKVLGKKVKEFHYPNSLVEVLVESMNPFRVWTSNT
ncbi:MAG: hypothetical protein PHN74_03365 [Candidatus Pacebacteria bacterium]|nr:hypothetical protein [Candidatus Paceibacterota bacterium]